MEEVDRYTYLGYVIRANVDQDDHLKERVVKGARILGKSWGIEKRKFARDRTRKIWLFDRLVWSVLSYGVEIWGWKAREELESIQDIYLRWLHGVSKRVSGYEGRGLNLVKVKRNWEEGLLRGEDIIKIESEKQQNS